MKHPAIFASDLHGNRFAYEHLFSFAKEAGIKTVILGGDLTPKWPILIFGRRGAIVPLLPAAFRPDENQHTYTAFLDEIARANAGSREVAERYYINLGGYVV